jgi:cell division protein FtsQ
MNEDKNDNKKNAEERTYAPTHGADKSVRTGGTLRAPRSAVYAPTRMIQFYEAVERDRKAREQGEQASDGVQTETTVTEAPPAATDEKQTFAPPALKKEPVPPTAKRESASPDAKKEPAPPATKKGPASPDAKKPQDAGPEILFRDKHYKEDDAKEIRKRKKKKRRNDEKWRKTRKRLAIVITVLAVILLIVAAYYVTLLRNVEVVGNDKYSAAAISELSGLVGGKNMFLCDLDAARANITSNPYLNVLKMERILPDTIRITLQERKETAVIMYLDYNVVIDESGYVLSIGGGGTYPDILHVIGMSATGLQVGRTLAQSDNFQAQTLLALLENLGKYDLIGTMEQVNISNPLRVEMRTREGLDIVLGEPDKLEEKMAWIVEVLPVLRERGYTEGTLNVGVVTGPVFSPATRQEPTNSEDADGPENEE